MAKFLKRKTLQIDERVFLPPLPPDKRDHAADKEEGEEADEIGGEPIVLLALVEHNLQAAHGDGEETEADIIHIEQAGAIGLDPRGIFDEAGDEKEGENADGDVDVEDPAPGEVVGDPAAEGGPDGGGEDGDEAVEGKGLAALLGRKGVSHDGLSHGLEAAAAGSLKDAEEQKHGQREGRAAEEAGDGEDDDAEDEEVAASEDTGGPSTERENDGIGDKVAGENPGALIGAGAKRTGDVGQRDVGDGGVENLHKGRQGHGHGDQPWVHPGLPARGQAGLRVVERHSDACGRRRCGLRRWQRSSPVQVLSMNLMGKLGELSPRVSAFVFRFGLAGMGFMDCNLGRENLSTAIPGLCRSPYGP